MKCKFLFAILLISCTVFSQTSFDKTIYLDSLYNETSEGNHKFYRVIKDYYLHTPSYKIFDYYKSGILQMEGISLAKDNILKEGLFIYYYENGNKESVKRFKKSVLNGKFTTYYESGNRKSEGEYLEDNRGETIMKILKFWNLQNVQTVINGNGEYDENTGTEINKGKIKAGYKDGTWTGTNKIFKFTYTEKYENGKFLSGISNDAQKAEHIYNVVELKPEPKKGIGHFYKYIGKNFEIPADIGKGGQVIVGFLIDKDGKIVEPLVIKGIADGTDREAVRVVASYKNWSPGELRGIKVRVAYSIPINLMPFE